MLEVFAELGVVFLLFAVGLESRLAEMREVGGRALRVGVLGMVLPSSPASGWARRWAKAARPASFWAPP